MYIDTDTKKDMENIFLRSGQGDPIVRIFAQGAIVYFGLLFDTFKSRPTFSGYFSPQYLTLFKCSPLIMPEPDPSMMYLFHVITKKLHMYRRFMP
jgi:hypothetical protein